MRNAVVGLVLAVAATIGAAKVAFELTANTNTGPVNEAWAQGTAEFRAWNNVRWTAWVINGEFVQIPEDTARWHRHSSPSIDFVDWEGVPVQAKVDGDAFLLAEHGDWNGHVEHSEVIRYRDWDGVRQLRTVAQLSR